MNSVGSHFSYIKILSIKILVFRVPLIAGNMNSIGSNFYFMIILMFCAPLNAFLFIYGWVCELIVHLLLVRFYWLIVSLFRFERLRCVVIIISVCFFD